MELDFDQILSQPVWIYVSHILTWSSLALLGIAFRNSVGRAFDLLKSSDQSSVVGRVSDRTMAGGAAIALFSFLLLFDMNLFIAIFLGLVLYIVMPQILRKRRFARYQKDFDASLVESLATVSSSLRAGLTLKDALVVSVQNCPVTFAQEISRVLKDYRFGKSIDQALDGVRKRVKTPNANIVFGALIIGTQLGGRIPEILNRIIQTIREVDRVEGRLKALTAQGRAQGGLLCSMPIIIFLGLYFFDREKINIMMSSGVGQVLLGMVVFLELLGIFVTLRVMRLKV